MPVGEGNELAAAQQPELPVLGSDPNVACPILAQDADAILAQPVFVFHAVIGEQPAILPLEQRRTGAPPHAPVPGCQHRADVGIALDGRAAQERIELSLVDAKQSVAAGSDPEHAIGGFGQRPGFGLDLSAPDGEDGDSLGFQAGQSPGPGADPKILFPILEKADRPVVREIGPLPNVRGWACGQRVEAAAPEGGPDGAVGPFNQPLDRVGRQAVLASVLPPFPPGAAEHDAACQAGPKIALPVLQEAARRRG